MTTQFPTKTAAEQALATALSTGRAVTGYVHSPNGCDWYAYVTDSNQTQFCLTR